MKYFDENFIEFLKELEKNNNREWFTQNKERYEKYVKLPFSIFTGNLIELVRDEDPEFCPDIKKAVYRIHRDIRFSEDKTPYKTHIAAAISYGGRMDFESPGFYIEISATHFTYYGGIYMLSKERLLKLRRFIITYKNEFNNLINEESFVKTFNKILGSGNKRLSPEFQKEASDFPLLFKKQFYFIAQYQSNIILKPDFLNFIYDHYITGRRVSDFIYEGMGLTK